MASNYVRALCSIPAIALGMFLWNQTRVSAQQRGHMPTFESWSDVGGGFILSGVVVAIMSLCCPSLFTKTIQDCASYVAAFLVAGVPAVLAIPGITNRFSRKLNFALAIIAGLSAIIGIPLIRTQ